MPDRGRHRSAGTARHPAQLPPREAAQYQRFDETDPSPFKYSSTEVLETKVYLPIQGTGAGGAAFSLHQTQGALFLVRPKPGPPISIVPSPHTGLATVSYAAPDNTFLPTVHHAGVTYHYVQGPELQLGDEFGNRVVEAGYQGAGNELTETAGDVGEVIGISGSPQIPPPGNPPSPPSLAVAGPGPGSSYYSVLLIQEGSTPPGAGSYQGVLRLQTSPQPTDEGVSILINAQVPITTWRCPLSNDQFCDGGEYGSYNGGTARALEGTLGMGGQKAIMRIHPVRSDQMWEDHPDHGTVITASYLVYVSGPTSSPSSILLDAGGNPVQVAGVGLRSCRVTAPGGVPQIGALGDEYVGQIPSLPSGTGFPSEGGTDGAAVWVSRAPKLPGFYQVIAKPLDGGLPGAFTDWDRAGLPFLVEGGRLLHEDFSPVDDYEVVERETTYWYEYVVRPNGDSPDNLEVRVEQPGPTTGDPRIDLIPVTSLQVRNGFYETRYLAEIHVKPTHEPVVGEEPCTACTEVEVASGPFFLEVGEAGTSPETGLGPHAAVMYGHNAVHEIPLGEYRRLTYATHRVPDDAPGAGDHPVVVEWQSDWAVALPSHSSDGVTPWFGEVVNPSTAWALLEYSYCRQANSMLTAWAGVFCIPQPAGPTLTLAMFALFTCPPTSCTVSTSARAGAAGQNG